MQATLTDQNILDILDAAGYGIAYWASKATVDEQARTYTVWQNADEDLPAARVISFDEIAEAFNKLLLNDEPRLVGAYVHKYFLYAYADRDASGIDAGHIDAEAADVLVQVAWFGEVIFG